MKIQEKIQTDLKKAIKTNNIIERDTLRFLNSLIKNTEIEKRKQSGKLSDDEVIKVISQSVKQRKESAKQYKKGGRNDLAEKEERELNIISNYLPQQLSAEEIEKTVKRIIGQTKAQSESDMGKVMGAVMKQIAGRADGNLVREIVVKFLKALK